MKRDLKAISIPRITHRLQSKRQALGVTILAARADLRAAGNGFHVASVHSIWEEGADEIPQPRLRFLPFPDIRTNSALSCKRFPAKIRRPKTRSFASSQMHLRLPDAATKRFDSYRPPGSSKTCRWCASSLRSR